MGAGPRTTIMGQPATAPRFGLLASIPATTEEARWETGIEYMPEGCQTGQTFDPCDFPENIPDMMPETVQWDPYFLSVSDRCSTFSGVEENEARVRRLLGMDQERQLGYELWTGTLAQTITGTPNTWLADGADPSFTELSNGPVGLVHGLACLENYLASNNGGQQGVIHATAQVVTHWESFRLLRREGNRILTFKDTIVIPSPGYTGTDPTGDIGDNNVWAYATDMPRIFLGPIKTSPLMNSIDRQDNTVLVVSQRPALVEWERCRHAGVQLCVTLCSDGS